MASSAPTSIEEESSSSAESELSAGITSGESADSSSGGGSDTGEEAQLPRRRPHRRSSDLFAHGQSRAAYKRSWDVSNEADPDDADEEEEQAQQAANQKKTCGCRVVLETHAETFKNMKSTGTALKKKQRYQPKGDATAAYRDVKGQNNWLLSNIFDVSGNYLYCVGCMVGVLGVGEKRLARLRKVKAGNLPPEHKLAGKQSHFAMPEVKAKFVEFVDASRAPNGRRVGSSSPEYYFDAVYSSFRSPDKIDKQYDTKVCVWGIVVLLVCLIIRLQFTSLDSYV